MKPDTFSYSIDEPVRSRLLHSLSPMPVTRYVGYDFEETLREVGSLLLARCGALRRPAYRAASRSDDPVIEHFFCCDDEEVLDFLELCFHARNHCGGNQGVQTINEVFEDEGIGYELSRMIEIQTDEPGYIGGRPAGRTIRYEYPKFIKKEDEIIHEEVIRPCLAVLADPRFHTANSEILAAHEKGRTGKHDDAMTSCASAFESVLKTICDIKKWNYDRDKDSCAKLIGICRSNGLFPKFYAPIFEATGTIRNKLSDAHGRGPSPTFTVEKCHADHMMHVTSAHIVLLIRLAKS